MVASSCMFSFFFSPLYVNHDDSQFYAFYVSKTMKFVIVLLMVQSLVVDTTLKLPIL